MPPGGATRRCYYRAMEPAPPVLPQSLSPAPEETPARGDQGRLWAPWRMRYVGGTSPGGCIFCDHLAGDGDVRALLLYRGDRAFAMLNLFPYNSGHLMLVPNDHVPGPEEADPAALAEIAALLPPTLRALRRTLGCAGFNVGLNVGAVAGAGIAAHQHQHVVPRWEGDANFMPILADTMVLPELLPATYAKVRAELARELGRGAPTARPADLAAPAATPVVAVVLDAAARHVAVLRDGDRPRLPSATAGVDEPIWRAAVRAAARVGGGDLVGWASPDRATPPPHADPQRASMAASGSDVLAPVALAFRASNGRAEPVGSNEAADLAPTFVAVEAAARDLPVADRAALDGALAHLGDDPAAS